MRRFLGAGVLAVLLSTTAIADTSSMSSTTTDMGVLENDYVKAGVNGTIPLHLDQVSAQMGPSWA